MPLSIDNFEQIPLKELETPKEGYEAIPQHYWAVINGNALFLRGVRYRNPQCNLDRDLMQALIQRLYPDAECTLIPIAFIQRKI